MRILFICTHNRCRSILSEAICNHLSCNHLNRNHLGKGKIQAFSAGSAPSGEVHPLSIKYLQERGIDTEYLRSQSWEDFATQDIDLAVTVCDSAADEPCPLWMGKCARVHWGLTDPSKVQGSEDEIKTAFHQTINLIEKRLQRVLDLDLSDNSTSEIAKIFDDIASEITECV